ncbi:hypothetical protein QQ045_016959 [Rhodiola kirilowii]
MDAIPIDRQSSAMDDVRWTSDGRNAADLSNPVSGGVIVDDKQAKYEEKKALVEEEVKRMNQLPARSTYVAHRMRVLSKVLQLLSVQRSASEEVELELLFSGLSL